MLRSKFEQAGLSFDEVFYDRCTKFILFASTVGSRPQLDGTAYDRADRGQYSGTVSIP